MFGTMMNNPLSVSMIVEHANCIHGNKNVYTSLPDGKLHKYTYSTLYSRVMGLADAITKSGIQQGEIVGTFATNTYQHLELCLAIPIIGSIIHPLNIRLSQCNLLRLSRKLITN